MLTTLASLTPQRSVPPRGLGLGWAGMAEREKRESQDDTLGASLLVVSVDSWRFVGVTVVVVSISHA